MPTGPGPARPSPRGVLGAPSRLTATPTSSRHTLSHHSHHSGCSPACTIVPHLRGETACQPEDGAVPSVDFRQVWMGQESPVL